MHSGAMTDPNVVHAEALRRYEIHVDDRIAGFAEYIDSGDQRIFFHTEVAEEFGGRGLGAVLVEAAVVDAINTGKRIVPVCTFVAKFLDENESYAKHADPVTQDELDTVSGSAS